MIRSFTVPGEPQGKARARATATSRGHVRLYTPAKTTSYEGAIRRAYGQAHGLRPDPAGTVYTVVVGAFFRSPKSISNKTVLDLQADAHSKPCAKKPDWDNVGKIVCDALNGICWHDDSQIVSGTVHKFWALPGEERLVVRITVGK